MTVAKQLLKEFWIPGAIALTWSALNFMALGQSERSFLKFVNVAGPTFFLVSWMTSQYFRVRKQEQVSSVLSGIEGRVDDVMKRIERQAASLTELANSNLVKTFDECIDGLREAKEDIADRNRSFKLNDDVDARLFFFRKGNPFYSLGRRADVLVSYAAHVIRTGCHLDLEDRYTRCAYHLEEIAGQVNNYIRRLNYRGVGWRSKRSEQLIRELCRVLRVFEADMVVYSKYNIEEYKGGQSFRRVINAHIESLEASVK